ncbi:MAG: CapA family protein [Firmicutes bacterium]|nr:CapA family protein [Bacillota bacterium]MCM1400945.1 CapA family protein [Bacteroides sp.]
MTICVAAVLLLTFGSCSGNAAAGKHEPGHETADTSAQVPDELSAPDTVTVSFAFMGDIMMGTTFPDSIHGSGLPADGGAHLFDDARTVTERVDVAGGNLEGSFLNGPGKRRRMTNPKTYFIFRMPEEHVENLVDAGFDFMGIANNHINDFGQPGRTSTMRTLRRANLPVVGLKDSCETAIINRKGLKIGVTQFGHGANNLDVTDLAELKRVVTVLRQECDLVVVSFHGGAEGTAHMHVPGKSETYVGENRGNVKEFARTAVDYGADIVFGHGPHVPRAAELYKGHIIFYSLGNFCTPFRMGIAGATGYAPIAEVKVDKSGRFVSGKIHSLLQHRGTGPRFDPTFSAAKLIKKLSEEDFPESSLRILSDGTLLQDKQ